MALQRRGEEPIRRGVSNPQPEPLGRFQIGVLMDEDTEGQVGPGSRGRVEEPQEELDQRRVAVREDDAVAASVRLVLGAFAPVGDGAGDEDLAIGQLADLGGSALADGGAAGLADGSLGRPLAASAFGRTLPAFRVTQPRWCGQVAYPEGNRALGHAESRGDLFVVQALAAQLASAGPKLILGVGP
jgi:hypothetical protein